MDELTQTFNTIKNSYNVVVADKLFAAHASIMSNEPKMLDAVAASMLVCRSIVGQYVEMAYPSDKSQEIPLDLRNMLYYLELSLASLSTRYIEQREKLPGIIL